MMNDDDDADDDADDDDDGPALEARLFLGFWSLGRAGPFGSSEDSGVSACANEDFPTSSFNQAS